MITQVGPGTPMGNLLRRYWTPACLSAEIPEPDCTPLRVRLLGEDLVAFRDSEGRVGLIDVNCPHRGTVLFLGRNAETGLRCAYHAPGTSSSGRSQWLFWAYDRAPRVAVVDTWHGFRAAGLRNTPKGNTHARLYQYTIPYTGGPGGGGWIVPIDDQTTFSYQFRTVNTAMKDQLIVGDETVGAGNAGGINRVGARAVRSRGLAFPGWPYD